MILCIIIKIPIQLTHNLVSNIYCGKGGKLGAIFGGIVAFLGMVGAIIGCYKSGCCKRYNSINIKRSGYNYNNNYNNNYDTYSNRYSNNDISVGGNSLGGHSVGGHSVGNNSLGGNNIANNDNDGCSGGA